MIAEEIKLSPSARAEKFKLENYTFKNQTSATNKVPVDEASESYSKATFTKRHHFTLAMTFLLLMGGAFSVYLLQPQFEEMNMSRMDTLGGMILLGVGIFLLLFRLGFLAYIASLFFRYKPVSSVSDKELPTCTVIVPAYNEGRLVYDTLISLTNSLYPAEKLQLLAIDDGSKDDTWEWMKKAKEELGDRVVILQQPNNQGKRHALYRGFNLGTGEVFVTVDSDSIVEKDTLRNLVSPFIT